MNYRHAELILVSLFLVLLNARLGLSQSLEVDDLFYKGDKNAKVVLIEFADYQCPFCARFYQETFPRIDEEYLLTGKVKFIFRNFPLEHSHPHAFKAAEAAICAGEQGKFWAMHSRLFRLQDTRYFNDWSQHAKALALNSTKFTQCLENEATASKVRKDLADGKNAGVKVTPTFLLGLPEEKSSKMKIFNKIEGAGAFSRFKEALDNILTLEK